MKITLTQFRQGGRGWMAILSSKGEGNDPWSAAGAVSCAWPAAWVTVSRQGMKTDLTEHCPILPYMCEHPCPPGCSRARHLCLLLNFQELALWQTGSVPAHPLCPPPPHSLERIYCWEESLGSRKVQGKKRPLGVLQLLSLQQAACKLFCIQCQGTYRKHSYFSS